MADELSRLSPEQRDLLAGWLPEATVLADLSWGLVETKVLDVVSEEGRLIVKAGGVADGHIARELRAHREWLRPWVLTGHAPSMLFGDEEAKILVTRYLPGELVEGTSAQDHPETYRQRARCLPPSTASSRSSTTIGTIGSGRAWCDISRGHTASIPRS